MFFSKPKIYKFEGQAVAYLCASKIKEIGLETFITNAEFYVKDSFQRHGIYKFSNKQGKQLAQLAIRYHEKGITRKTPIEGQVAFLRDSILKDFS